MRRPRSRLAEATAGDRRRGRLLASTIGVLGATGIVCITVQLALVPGFLPTFVAVSAALAVLVVAWGLLRAGRHGAAVLVTAMVPTGGALAASAANPADPIAAAFALLGILLASVFLSIRVTAAVGATAIAGVAVVGAVGPALPRGTLIAALCLLAVGSALILLAKHHRDQVEADRAADDRRLREELLRADRLRTLGVLAASIAHEIRNPLTCALGSVELVSRREPSAHLENARRAIDRIATIVRELHEFARVDDDRDGPVDVRQVLESAIAMAAMQIRHRARVVLAVDAGAPVRASARRLEQVFVNLLLEVAHMIPADAAEGHEIRVRLGRAGAGRIEIVVEDAGCEAAAAAQDPDGGSLPGGLAISRTIVASIGGELAVERARGGTTFRVTLPAAP